MNIIHRNLFAKLRIDNFSTKESLEPMSKFKMKKLMGLIKNIAEMPAGEVTMSNPILKARLKKLIAVIFRFVWAGFFNANITSLFIA